jgi:hypothetical protein
MTAPELKRLAAQLVGRIGAKRNPPFASEPKAGYGFASNPPYAPTPAMRRDLPVGRECFRSPSLLLSRKRFRTRNQLRLKTKFRRFQSDDPCPDLARKIFRFAIS